MKCWLDRIIFPSVQRSFVSFKTNYQSSVTWNKSWLHHSIVLSLGPITINSTSEVHCKPKLAKMSECALWMKWIGITFSGHPYIGTPNFPFYDLKICTHENVAVKFPVSSERETIKERRWCGETSFSNTGKHIVNVVICYKTLQQRLHLYLWERHHLFIAFYFEAVLPLRCGEIDSRDVGVSTLLLSCVGVPSVDILAHNIF